MNTTSTYTSGRLTIAIKGRVDGSETPKLQQDINALIAEHSDLKEIVIDAAEMPYISSMGLRALLQLRQDQTSLRIINVSADVYNVFKMTGFTQIFDVEKTLPQVDIDGLKLVEGMDSVYQLTDETMLKVFPEGTTREDVEREITLTKALLVRGITTAMAFDMVMVGNRRGLVFEGISPSPLNAQQLGAFIRTLHEQEVEPDGQIPSASDREKAQIKALQPYLGDEAVNKLLQMLSTLPDGSALLHGNICPTTVMQNNGEPIMVDMREIGYGNPALDLAHLYAALPDDHKEEFFDEFLDEYYDMESDETIKRNRQSIITLSIIRDFTKLALYGEPTTEAIEASRKDFAERVTGNWEEILSHLRFKMDFNEEIRKLERKRFYLDCDVDIDWVASKLGTNRHYVSDYFNKVLHTTFNDYINTLRLDYAVQLIRAGKTAPSQIAYEAGFGNDHTFRRLFKQRFGCTPSQFEK